MKHIKRNYLFIALAFTAILASCHKDKVTPTTDKPTAQRAGIYILNQGGIGHNNSTLTYYDYTSKSLVADQFFHCQRALAELTNGDGGTVEGQRGNNDVDA